MGEHDMQKFKDDPQKKRVIRFFMMQMPNLSLKIYIGNVDIHPNTHLKNSEKTTKQKQRVQIAECSLFLM